MIEHPEWPALPLQEWQDTYRTLHMWTQVVGKIRMALAPPLNHYWHVTLYVNSRGLTTGPVPFPNGAFEIQFDFLNHELQVTTSRNSVDKLALRSESVAQFYKNVMDLLAAREIRVNIDPKPQEVPNPVPFHDDHVNATYDPEYAWRFWRILLSTAQVQERFRSKFIGKCSPVHFFWGSFDLACTRFSGRVAPARKGVISGPAYSHECSSAGFWPGGGLVEGPAFYAYTVPKPDGLDQEKVKPAAAGWHSQLSEFLLLYDDVRQSASPDQAVYDFFESTYAAGAQLGNWDRKALEV
jgi:hypothetical protein